jgi:hypothetical protein
MKNRVVAAAVMLFVKGATDVDVGAGTDGPWFV